MRWIWFLLLSLYVSIVSASGLYADDEKSNSQNVAVKKERIKQFTDNEKKLDWTERKQMLVNFEINDNSTNNLPEISIEELNVRRAGRKFEVSFQLAQHGKVYDLDIPVAFYLRGEKINVSYKNDNSSVKIIRLFDTEPHKIVLDEDYKLFRKLADSEIPAVLSRVIGAKKILTALPVSNKEAYGSIIEAFKKKGAQDNESAAIKDSDIKASSVVILGKDNPLISRLYAKVNMPYAGFSVAVKENPWNPKGAVAIIDAKNKEEAEAALKNLFTYGQYSLLAFENGRNISKSVNENERGIVMDLKEEPVVIETSALKTLNDLIEKISKKKILYVGEAHDRFSHHDIQLKIIEGLFSKNKKIAIGMEMFQRPYQKALDEYISGEIDEKEFLKKSEYFKKWGLDYNLYKPILDFARAEKIPVVALNITREITEKTAKTGMDSLSDEERKLIPEQLDFSDNDYRERLKDIFDKHGYSKSRSFDFFYQAQILWDETMSMSIDEYFRKNPDFQSSGQMVVIAGGGHFEYGSGIPKRTFRRNGYDYAIIMNEGSIEKDAADYIVLRRPMDGISSPRLMALLSDKEAGIKVLAFPENSVSEKAGIKVGDKITSLDGNAVSKIEDIKLHLFYKKSGDIVKVKALRKRFLLGEKEIEFEVKL
ncbi:MAG: ChaN family lipoprotein [Nitrospirae bacterium]|nr:ChaN family lipoprotein [Nitrospirota bacterium]